MRTEPQLALTSSYHPCNQVAHILRAHLASALNLLDSRRPSGARIHAARQELKRSRAALRLVRESIEPQHFTEEDATLRQAARQLNDVRDCEVVLRVLSRLRPAFRDQPQPPNLEPLRTLLQRERRAAASAAFREPLAVARALLLQTRERSRTWSVENDPQLLTAAMRRTYRKGRAAYRAACDSRTDEHLHAWRRQVKYSAYQLEALGSLAAAGMRKRLRRCARLAKLLGRDHDLLLLQRKVAGASLDAASSLQVCKAIKRERARLQRRALQLGARLYRTKPREFRPLS